MPSDHLTIKHRTGSYRVAFTDFAGAMAALPERSVIVTDENVAAAWGHAFPSSIPTFAVPPGEASKSLQRYGALLAALAQAGVDRSGTVVAVGGGVVGDLAGFVAATYMRGVKFVQVPTTLLAQVDSAVGGKVGVDTAEGKNLVGAFLPPEAVWVASESLRTLPLRQFTNGMAEVWKYGFILDAGLVEFLESKPLSPSDERLEAVVRRCIELKAQVVEEDELDLAGKRAVLNFGHTVGHALECWTGYGPLLHGEAVAVGMVVEALLGERLGVTEPGTSARIRRCLESQGLPTTHEGLQEADALMDAMRRDKKVQDGVPAFILLTCVGASKLVTGIPSDEVRSVLQQI